MLALTAGVETLEVKKTAKQGGSQLARPNYSGEKRRKDLAKKAKKEEKRLRKLHGKENLPSRDAEAAESDDASKETTGEG